MFVWACLASGACSHRTHSIWFSVCCFGHLSKLALRRIKYRKLRSTFVIPAKLKHNKFNHRVSLKSIIMHYEIQYDMFTLLCGTLLEKWSLSENRFRKYDSRIMSLLFPIAWKYSSIYIVLLASFWSWYRIDIFGAGVGSPLIWVSSRRVWVRRKASSKSGGGAGHRCSCELALHLGHAVIAPTASDSVSVALATFQISRLGSQLWMFCVKIISIIKL